MDFLQFGPGRSPVPLPSSLPLASYSPPRCAVHNKPPHIAPSLPMAPLFFPFFLTAPTLKPVVGFISGIKGEMLALVQRAVPPTHSLTNEL